MLIIVIQTHKSNLNQTFKSKQVLIKEEETSNHYLTLDKFIHVSGEVLIKLYCNSNFDKKFELL